MHNHSDNFFKKKLIFKPETLVGSCEEKKRRIFTRGQLTIILLRNSTWNDDNNSDNDNGHDNPYRRGDNAQNSKSFRKMQKKKE